MIIEYLQVLNSFGTIIDPRWARPLSSVDQGWHDPDRASYVGLSVAGEALGPGAVALSDSELLARAQSIHARYPITDPATGDPYTDEALEQAVTDWISAAVIGEQAG